MTENEIAKIAVDVANHLHSSLGPGLLESVYQELYVFKLKEKDLLVETEVRSGLKNPKRSLRAVFWRSNLSFCSVSREIASLPRKDNLIFEMGSSFPVI